ncbi:50S ribosomal protein L9 [Candidatus Riflebacteria bacterium]
MEVILMKDIENLGRKGNIIRVKDGFARNFLLPKKLAEIATPGRLKNIKKESSADKKRYLKEIASAEEVRNEINALHITMQKKVGSKGRLFGSVKTSEIAEAIAKKARISIDKKQITADVVKNLGDYKVKVKLLPEVIAEMTLTIVGEDGETAESVKAEIEKAETPPKTVAAPEPTEKEEKKPKAKAEKEKKSS